MVGYWPPHRCATVCSDSRRAASDPVFSPVHVMLRGTGMDRETEHPLVGLARRWGAPGFAGDGVVLPSDALDALPGCLPAIADVLREDTTAFVAWIRWAEAVSPALC